MSGYDSVFTEGGAAFWTDFSATDPSSFAGRNGSLRPGSNRLRFNEDFFHPDRDTDDSIINLDLLKTQNRLLHHCENYGVKSLVVRRGQEFKLKINLSSKPFNKEKDRFQIVFMKGRFPREGKGTLIRIPIYEDKISAQNAQRGFDWLGYIVSHETTSYSAEVTVSITPKTDALIGTYKVKTIFFRLDFDGKIKKHVKEEDEVVYLLFNPWCKDDQVYMENEDERTEYVLNETGKIWVGSSFWNTGRAWNFGQFAKKCTEAAFYLLDNSYLKPESHGNATLVCRALSSMANSFDTDKGVLTGNWSGDYSDGVSPSSWNGSVAILEQYMDTKQSVEYGQCWVFSGLLTTLCRALGIPTRSVTNFDSAHDTDYSMTIDTHTTEDGDSMSHLDDSVWNFHVWNEAWFKRPDLPQGYDGWQAIDATPQEESDEKMQCGPAPLKAIKEGNVFLGHDTKFVFAEVNADRMTWVVKEDGTREPIKTEKDTVGNKISTKAVGNDERNDITDSYKYPEGSTEERECVTRASNFSSRKQELIEHYRKTPEDVEFTWEDETIEGDISIKLTIENKSDQPRGIYLKAVANAIYYTGRMGKVLGESKAEGTLQPGQKVSQNLKLNARFYLNMIDEDAKANVMIFSKVKDTKQIWRKEKRFELEKPDLKLELSNTWPKVGEEFTVTISFKNPVKTRLTEGKINLEGPGIQKNKKISFGPDKDLLEGAELKHTVTLTAKYPGKRELIACYNSRQVTNINGAVMVYVQSAN